MLALHQHLRSANRQLVAVYRYRLNTYGHQAFLVDRRPPQSGTLSGFHPGPDHKCRVQTVSDVCLKRTCSLDTSAFSVLEVLDDNRAL